MYTIKKLEERCIKNHHGRPGFGKEVRWYIMDGNNKYHDKYGCVVYFTRKYMAENECRKMNGI